MRFDVVGAQVKIDPDAVRKLIEATADEVLPAAGEIVVGDIKRSFTSAKGEGANQATGDEYEKYKFRGNEATLKRKARKPTMHTASAPGQPPAVDTGTLRASISYYYDRTTRTCYLGTPVEYAGYLEFGTKKKNGEAKMYPRPYFRPAAYAYAGNDRLVKKIAVHLRTIRKRAGK